MIVHIQRQSASLARRQCCRPKRGRSTVAGFTLIELLLATLIFAIVLVSINTVFFAALHLRRSATEALEESVPLNQALGILRRDLQNAITPGGVLAGNFRSGNQGGGFGGVANSTGSSTAGSTGGAATAGVAGSLTALNGLDFFTSTGTLSDNAPWGDIQEVNYQLMESTEKANASGRDLVRSVTRNLLSFSAQPPEVQRLASSIERLDFEFYDGVQWRDTWDTTAGDSGLPMAVRVSVQLAARDNATTVRSEPLQMIVLLQGQSVTNQTQVTGATGGTQ